MDKPLNYLALAHKARLAELGEEPVGSAARAGKAYAVLVARDASDHTWRRSLSFVAGTQQQCIRLPYSKAEMGAVVGRESLAIAAITDVSMALALVASLPEPPAAAMEVLSAKSQKAKKRKAEAEQHRKNVRMGKNK